MALVFFYTFWNISENQRFPDVFKGIEGHSAMKWVKVI